MVALLEKHLRDVTGKPGNAELAESRDYIFHIIAANYIDGIIENYERFPQPGMDRRELKNAAYLSYKWH